LLRVESWYSSSLCTMSSSHAGAARQRPGKGIHADEDSAPAASHETENIQQQLLQEQEQQLEFERALQRGMSSPAVLLPSTLAWNVLLAVPLILWIVATAAGIMHFNGLPNKKSDVIHIMLWFDLLIFRKFGSLLPFIPLAARVAAVTLLGRASIWWSQRRHDSRPPTPLCTLALPCSCAYVLVVVVRIALYMLHLAAQGAAKSVSSSSSTEAPEPSAAWVSDHVFLGASVVACLQVEVVCGISDVIKLEVYGANIVRELLAGLAFMTSLFTHVMVCADMYFTTRFYHVPMESFLGVLAGLLIFQLPLLVWLSRSSKQAARRQ